MNENLIRPVDWTQEATRAPEYGDTALLVNDRYNGTILISDGEPIIAVCNRTVFDVEDDGNGNIRVLGLDADVTVDSPCINKFLDDQDAVYGYHRTLMERFEDIMGIYAKAAYQYYCRWDDKVETVYACQMELYTYDTECCILLTLDNMFDLQRLSEELYDAVVDCFVQEISDDSYCAPPNPYQVALAATLNNNKDCAVDLYRSDANDYISALCACDEIGLVVANDEGSSDWLGWYTPDELGELLRKNTFVDPDDVLYVQVDGKSYSLTALELNRSDEKANIDLVGELIMPVTRYLIYVDYPETMYALLNAMDAHGIYNALTTATASQLLGESYEVAYRARYGCEVGTNRPDWMLCDTP
jgi:hypothetical protein